MTQIVLLSKETHRSLKVDGRASAAYGDDRHFVQVTVNEFPLLVVHYPLFFSKDPNTGGLYCGVMLGFKEGENLFLREWEEREFYRPLILQRGPFYAQGPELAIDLDHPRVGAENGKPLFTDYGQPTRATAGRSHQEARFERATEPAPLKDRALALLTEGGSQS